MIYSKLQQAQFFGQPVKIFDIGELKKRLAFPKDKELHIGNAREYLQGYFIRVMNREGVLFWDARKRKVKWLSFKETKMFHLPNDIDAMYNEIKGKFNMATWFFGSENQIKVVQCVRSNKPMCFMKDDIIYINTCPPPLYLERKKFKKLSDFAIKGTVAIFNAMYLIWCASEIEFFKYIHNWFTNAVVGIKMYDSMICLCSGLRSEKMKILSFFLNKVIGTARSLIIDGDELDIEKLEKLILGKTLLVIDEKSKNIDKILKILSKRKICIGEKFGTDEDGFKNTCNILLTTDKHSSTINDNSGRCVKTNISGCKRNNMKFFTNLNKYLCKEVAEAISWYSHEHVERNIKFDDSLIPEINEQKKADLSLPVDIQYLNETYLNDNNPKTSESKVVVLFKDIFEKMGEFSKIHNKQKILLGRNNQSSRWRDIFGKESLIYSSAHDGQLVFSIEKKILKKKCDKIISKHFTDLKK